MHAGSGSVKRQVFSDINITPLTDIFLVLLIIMMVVAPMVHQGRQDIKPPNLQSGQPVEQNRLTVEIDKAGAFFVDGKPVADTELTSVLKERADKLEEKNVIIRADKETRSGAVMKVFEAARDADYVKVTVAGEALSKDRQEHLNQQQAAPAAPPSDEAQSRLAVPQ